jgi:hypothetical protein
MKNRSTIVVTFMLLIAIAPPQSFSAFGKEQVRKTQATLQQITLSVTSLSGHRPASAKIFVGVQYGEATVSHADNFAPGESFSLGKPVTVNLPVEYNLHRKDAERGPELCFALQPFEGSEWRISADLALKYSDGGRVAFHADNLAFDVKQPSQCKSFWHD